LSYAELNAQANRLARHLVALGVRPDDRVGLCVERSVEMVVGLLAVLKAGGAYVPLDPAYPSERLAFMLEDSAPAVVLTHPAARHALDAAAARLERAPVLLDLVENADRWADQPDTDLDPHTLELGPQHLAYVIYTSGSTGTPKGVMVEHRALAATLTDAAKRLRLSANDAMPNLASFAFDISLLELLLPLLCGAHTRLLDRHVLNDLDALIEQTRTATLLHAVPSLMSAWSERLGSRARQAYLHLRTLRVGGEPVP